MQKKGIQIQLAASDKLNAAFDQLTTMEKQIPSIIATAKKQIDDELKKLMIASDKVFFEYDSLKDQVVALIGEQGAKSWQSANNGKENYADMVQKAIVNFRKKLDSLNYQG